MKHYYKGTQANYPGPAASPVSLAKHNEWKQGEQLAFLLHLLSPLIAVL